MEFLVPVHTNTYTRCTRCRIAVEIMEVSSAQQCRTPNNYEIPTSSIFAITSHDTSHPNFLVVRGFSLWGHIFQTSNNIFAALFLIMIRLIPDCISALRRGFQAMRPIDQIKFDRPKKPACASDGLFSCLDAARSCLWSSPLRPCTFFAPE